MALRRMLFGKVYHIMHMVLDMDYLKLHVNLNTKQGKKAN